MHGIDAAIHTRKGILPVGSDDYENPDAFALFLEFLATEQAEGAVVLRTIDPYGWTIFTPYQMDRLILEVDQLQGVISGELLKVASDLKEAFLQCKENPDVSYLRFEGD
ncbi:hypothetical protein [Armatimonas rosea]|uniref:Uncharacterized protein n=1 Tax=Armatimonas rosea TaxID=685828 RepID=A0A7W9W800_ARMRO|nr:hypothetical protein [Armatimonas rosea]MBB6051766.1 hypothetical protein [Armatimonas rosea]